MVKKYYAGKRPDWMEFENEQQVTLTDDYFIGQFEVTRGQFRRFIEDSGYKTETEQTDGGYGWSEELKKFEGRDRKYSWKNTGAPGQSDEHPVTNITPTDARKFCEWLAKKADGKVKLRDVRLPGEAEWEFACQAGGTGRFSFGDDEEKLVEYANVADATWNERFPNPKAIKAKDGHVFAAPVGQFKPNAFGLYDMHGNVWEWCEDWYDPMGYTTDKVKDPTGPITGSARVQRGGGLSSAPHRTRSASRVGRDPASYRGAYLGFRIALPAESR